MWLAPPEPGMGWLVLVGLGRLGPVLLERLAKRLQQDGYHLLIFVSDSTNSDDLVAEILQYNVDGIVLGATTLSSALAQRCADASIPVVLFNRVMASGSAGAVSNVPDEGKDSRRANLRRQRLAQHPAAARCPRPARRSTPGRCRT